MYALASNTFETGPVPTAPSFRPRPAAVAVPGPWNRVAGASVRHVLRAIASEPAASRRQWRARVRPLIEREQASLRARFEADGMVEALLRGRTRLADATVTGLLHLARAEVRSAGPGSMIAPLAVMALGGYGRNELAPASDLDLLFVLAYSPHERRRAEGLIGFVLTGLWDVGFEVGHATCTIDQCRALAASEPTVLASLLDARFVAGGVSLHGLLEVALRQMADAGRAASAAAAIAAETSPGTVDEEEPDVKRGRGGLRDIQRLLWLAQLRHGSATGMPAPAATLVEARRFLWQVRAHLHLIAGRAEDRLRRDLQPLVATRLRLGSGGAGADALLRLYRRHTQSICRLLALA